MKNIDPKRSEQACALRMRCIEVAAPLVVSKGGDHQAVVEAAKAFWEFVFATDSSPD